MAAAPNKENTAIAWLKRLWPLLLLLAGTAFVFAMGWHRYITLQELVDRREALRSSIAGHTVLAILAFMAIYAATVALSLPGAAVLTLAGGFLFGWFWGGLASMVGGGSGNLASGYLSTAAGGESDTASGDHSAVGGGSGNTASSAYSTVAGGEFNTASSFASTVAGGYGNSASGSLSFAAGRQAKATHTGSFVWGDDNAFDIGSYGVDTFTARSTGRL